SAMACRPPGAVQARPARIDGRGSPDCGRCEGPFPRLTGRWQARTGTGTACTAAERTPGSAGQGAIGKDAPRASEEGCEHLGEGYRSVLLLAVLEHGDQRAADRKA